MFDRKVMYFLHFDIAFLSNIKTLTFRKIKALFLIRLLLVVFVY